MALLSPQHASPQLPLGLGVGSRAPLTAASPLQRTDPGYHLRVPQPLLSRRPSDFPAKRPREHLPIFPRSNLSAVCNSVREEPLSSSRETRGKRG